MQSVTPENAFQMLHEGAVLVTASRRLARSLRMQYNDLRRLQGDTVWSTPEVLPWSSWLTKLWENNLYCARPNDQNIRVLLSASQEQFLWRRVVESSPEANGLLHVSATAEAAATSWNLSKSWLLELKALEATASEDTKAFLGWAHEFQRICLSQGWIDQASLPDYLVPYLKGLGLPRNILLAGFDELSPQQSKFLDLCLEAEAQVGFVDRASFGESSRVVRVAFRDFAEEISASARWARGLLEAGATGPIGIVIAGLAGLREKIEQIFTEVLNPAGTLPDSDIAAQPFNVSAGVILAKYPVVRAALLILDLDPDANEFERISALLRSPYLSGGETEWTNRSMLDAKLREFGNVEISIEGIRKAAQIGKIECPILTKVLTNWLGARGSIPSKQRPSEWSRSFSLLLQTFGWPGERSLNSREYQVAEKWNELLSELARLDGVVQAMTYLEALGHLKRLAADTMFQPEGESVAVQILGMLEASGIRFEHLWVAGLHDEAWPPAATPDPFLPISIQRKHGMPHASPERELEFSRLITKRLIESSQDVVVSYPTQDEDRDLGPSPLISAIPQIEVSDLGLPPHQSWAALIRASARLDILEDNQAPPVEEGAWQRGGTKVFQYQAACPFRAFGELRLSAKALESPKPGLSLRDRGVLVHTVLENIWKRLRSQAHLLSLSSTELSSVIQDAVGKAIDLFDAEHGGQLTPKVAKIEHLRLERLLAEVVEIEKGRPPFDVIQPEGERYAELGGIRFKVKLDRVDRITDGRDVIIDYKTGKPSVRDWEGDRPDEPQLPLYAVTHEGSLVAVVYWQIRIGDVKIKGIREASAVLPGTESVELTVRLADWREILERLAGEFRAGRAVVEPKDPNQTCRTCSLPALCRVKEINSEISDTDGEIE